jgi:hypothetical protein
MILASWHKAKSSNLSSSFNAFFIPVSQKHRYNTRLASKSTYSLPKIRTSYGKFNIRFAGAKVWNSICEFSKKLEKNRKTSE